MELLLDKFKIIKDNIKDTDDDDENSIIANFIENYLESNIFNIHPYYFFQLSKKNKLFNINECIHNKLDIYLKDMRNNVRILIKKSHYDLYNGLNRLLISYITKIDKIKTIFNNIDDNSYNKFNTIIIHDPQIICLLKLELDTLEENKKNEIKNFINNIYYIDKNSNKVNYIWLLKLISSILIKNFNIDYINTHVPINYMLMINLIKIINDYQIILNYYNYIKKEYIIYIETPIINLISKQFNNLIKIINIKELTYLLKNKGEYLNIESILYKNKQIITQYINTYIFNNKDTFNIDKIYNLFELLITTNKLKLIDSYLLLTLNNLNIVPFIHEIIHNYIYINNKYILEFINFIMCNITDKYGFINQYQTFLVKRLLSSKSNIILENNCIYEIAKFGEKYINKLFKIINDKESSIDDINNFYSLKNIDNNDKLCILTTSYNNWNINYNLGSLNSEIINSNSSTSTSNFCKLLDKYNKFYNLRYENKRKLIWFPHYGQVNITYEYDSNKFINIILLPIQLLILELFDYNNEIEYDIIKNQTFLNEYSNKYKDDIIKSLIIGKILVKNNNILKVSKININNNSINLIDIFYNNSTFIVDEENNSLEDLALSKNDIISCVVNHIVKKEEKSFDELLNEINQELKIFSVTNSMLSQVLDKMISMDYIIFDDNKYHKIFY